MIYCGYQGVGKTTYCKTHPMCIDLDSSHFKKTTNWFKRYVGLAYAWSLKGYTCFISAHKEVINFIREKGYEFAIVVPNETKETWHARLLFRYEQTKAQYAYNALMDFEQNYDTDMAFYNSIDCPKIFVSAKVVTTLHTI